MANLHLHGTDDLEDHSVLNEDQVVTKKRNQDTGGTGCTSCRCRSRVCSSCRCRIAAVLLSTVLLAFIGLGLHFYFAAHNKYQYAFEQVRNNTEATLVVLPQTLADETGAFCLDGSPPSYYFRNGETYQIFSTAHVS